MTWKLFLLWLGLGLGLGGRAEAGAAADEPPLIEWFGLHYGSTREQALEQLGPPAAPPEGEGNRLWFASRTRPGYVDVLEFGREGLISVEAASVPEDLANEELIRRQLGPPEWIVRFAAQTLAEYTERGARFVYDATGTTVGVVLFRPGERHVPAGEPSVDLRKQLHRPLEGNAPAAPEGFRLGLAQAAITPPDPAWLNEAWSARMTVHDDLLVQAAVFVNGEESLALVVLDVFGLTKTDLDRIRRGLAERGWPQAILNQSHTHDAPDTIGIYGHYPAEYVDYLVAQTVRCVDQAGQQLQPVGQLRMASTELPLVGGRVDGISYNGRHAGLVDPHLALIQALDREGRVLASLVNFALHPEVVGDDPCLLSADFVHFLRRDLEEAFGGEVLFLQGPLGGMLTPDITARTPEEAERVGRRLAEHVRTLAEELRPSQSYRLELRTRPIQIPVTSRTILDYVAVNPERTPLHHQRHLTELNLITLGDAQILTFPGELLPELALDIRQRMTGRPNLMLGLTNDEIGYIIPAYDYQEGRYEERMSLGAAAGPVVRGAALELLE